MKIISADERLAERRGVKALIIGPSGVGKTTLLRTLESTTTLFVDIEAGDLAVQDVPVDTIRIDDWSAARDLACRIGGPHPNFPPTARFSEAHYQAVRGPPAGLPPDNTSFVHRPTARRRLSFPSAAPQPHRF